MTVSPAKSSPEQRFLSVRIDPTLHDQLAESARTSDRSVGAVVRIALRQYLDGQAEKAAA